jgi:hypothetical protein
VTVTTSCARCGYGNDVGSRFCGECGIKLPDAVPIEEVPTPSTVPLVVAAEPMPTPLAMETAILPPVRGVFDPTDPSMRMPVAKVSTIAVIVVLMLDAGLATAGALLLKAGLAGKAGKTATTEVAEAPAEAPASGTAPATGTAPVTGTAPATGTGTAPATGRAPATGSGTAAATGSGTATSSSSGTTHRSDTVSGYVSDLFGKTPDAGVAVVDHADAAIAVSAPPPDAAPPPPPPPDAAPPPPDAAGDTVDPYGGSGSGSDVTPPPDANEVPADPQTEDLAAQVERKSSTSQAHFTRCYQESAKAYTPDQPLTGEVDIAFRVMPTGEVQGAEAVKNTTGSDKLADCLVAVIGAWSFSASGLTEPAVFVRPIHFDGH